MITDEEKLGNVKAYLQDFRADFCLVYRGTENKEVHWIRPMSYASETCVDCAELATKYVALATHRWQEKQSLILEEKKGTESIPWLGLLIPTGEPTSFPANALGERWWTVIVVSGTTPQLGYVIVTRIPAKDSKDCRKCILDIQAIICPHSVEANNAQSHDPSRRPAPHKVWLRRLVRIVGLLSIILLLIVRTRFVGMLVLFGAAGTYYFLWPERFPSRVMSLGEKRRVGILLWLYVAFAVIVLKK
jgi:hypothetical protein